MVTKHYLCKVYNYHDSRACGYKRSRILPRIVGLVRNGVVFVENFVIPLCLCDIL
jgi:hypothetical protein